MLGMQRASLATKQTHCPYSIYESHSSDIASHRVSVFPMLQTEIQIHFFGIFSVLETDTRSPKKLVDAQVNRRFTGVL